MYLIERMRGEKRKEKMSDGGRKEGKRKKGGKKEKAFPLSLYLFCILSSNLSFSLSTHISIKLCIF